MTSLNNKRLRAVVTAVGATLLAATLGVPTAAAATPAATGITLPAGFSATVFAASPNAKVTGPDDMVTLGEHIFVGYQNGVGAKGEPAPSGQTKSTLVEYDAHGQKVASWDLTGKIDGLGADPTRDRVIATVNEDGNSSLYTVSPGEDDGHGGAVQHFQYNAKQLSHGGGTDSVVVRNGTIFITASAPAPNTDGTTFSQPAQYRATLDDGTVNLTPVLSDNSVATDAVTGKQVTLNLSDPDSSEIVPHAVPRFGGDLLVDSQGDGQLIFLSHPGRHDQHATVLNINTQVDDSAFASSTHGTLYVVDSAKGQIIAITGTFQRGQAFTSVPSGSPTAAALGSLNLANGTVSNFGTGFGSPKGLLFVPASDNDH
jgi:hypothetical protein